jgi:hypothetical protein
MVLKFEFVEGTPDDLGTYLFLLKNGEIREAYYGSFPYPDSEKGTVKYSDLEEERFYFEVAVGWFKPVIDEVVVTA